MFSVNRVSPSNCEDLSSYSNRNKYPLSRDFDFEFEDKYPTDRRLSLTISAPIYVRDVPRVALSYSDEGTYLCCTVITIVIFLPIWFLWLPALVASKKSRIKFMDGNYMEGKAWSRKCLFLNISCVIVGLIIYAATASCIVYFILWN